MKMNFIYAGVFMLLACQKSGDNADGTPLDLFGGRPGSMAAFVVAAYMKGAPMIYNGHEGGI